MWWLVISLSVVIIMLVMQLFITARQARQKQNKKPEKDADLHKQFNGGFPQQVGKNGNDLNLIFERISDAFIALDKSYRYMYVNKRAAEILGHQPQELIGKVTWDVFPATIGTTLYDACVKAFTQQQYVFLEDYYPAFDRWYENHIYPSPEGLSVFFRDIKEKKNAELALKESAEKYHILFENNLSGIYRTTLDGRIVDANNAFAVMVGYTSSKDLVQNNAYSLYFSSSDREDFISSLQKNGLLTNYETTMKHKDGRKVYIIENVSLRKDAHTGEQFIEGVVMDITQKKKTEDELFRERNLLRTLIDNLPDYIYVKDTNYRHLINNRANVSLIGAETEEETLGKTVMDYFKPEIAHQFIEDDKKVIQTGEPVINREEPVMTDNSEQRWLLTTKIPLFDHNNSPTGLVGISRDITEHKKAEKAIKESEAKLLASIENTPNVAVQWYNTKGEVLFWNHASERMFGWESSEALGKTLDQLIHTPEETAAFLATLKDIEKTGQTIGPAEFTFKNRNGGKGFCISTIFPIPAIAGEPCFVCMDVDITERKKTEEDLRLKENAINTSISGMGMTDLDGTIIYANETLGKMWGCADKNELLGKKLADVFEGPRVLQTIKALQTYGFENGEDIGKKMDGSLFHVAFSANIILDDNQNPVCMFGSFLDITEKKKAEEKLRKNFEQLQTLSHLSDTVGRTKKLEDIYHVALQSLRQTINADRASVLLFDREGVMRFMASTGLSDEYKQAAEGHSPWSADEKNPQPIFISNVEKEPSLRNLLPVIQNEGIRALGFIPLMHQNSLLGKFMVYFNNEHQFNEEEVHLTQTIAQDVAFAIWERKSEIALRESENRLRTILNSEPECVKLLGKNGQLLDMNPAGLAMIEADNIEQVLGHSVINIVEPSYQAAFTQLTNNVFEGKSGSLQFEIVGLKGTKRWLETHAVPLKDDEGDIISLLGVTRDITERKRNEDKIREKNEALKNALQELNDIIENSTDTIFKLDTAGNLIFVSPEFYRALGFTPDEMQGKHFADIVYPEDIPVCQAAFITAIQTRVPQRDLIYRAKTKDGQLRWSNTSASLVCNEAGEPQYILGISKDITELTEASAMLEAAEERYRAFIQQSSEGIWRLEIPGGVSVNASAEEIVNYTVEYGYFAECNDVYAKMYGYENAEKMIGRKLQHVMPVDDPPNMEYFINFINSGFKISEAESVEFDKEGNKKIFLNNLSGIIENDKLIRVWGTQRDITERNKADLALKTSEDRYKAFIQQSSEAIWRGELTEPVNCNDPVDKQLQHFYEKSYLAECNDQMAKLYGLKEARQLMGAKLSDFIKINAELTQALSHQFVQNGYRLHRSPSIQTDVNGNRKYYLNNMVGIVENGYVVRVWGMQTDVTEQRLAEKKIWHLASLVDNTTDTIVSHNLQLEIMSWNKAAEKIYEIPASIAIGKIFKDIVSVELLNNTSREAILQQVFEKGSCNSEILFINSAGKKIYLSVTISKWYDSSGKHKGFLSIAREITDVYIAREKLEGSEQFYKSLISDSVDGTVVLNENGYITYAAPSVTNVLGYTVEEMLGKRADEFIFPDDVDDGHKIFFDEMNGESASWYHEVRYVSKDNRVIWVMMRVHNMLKNTNVKGIAVYFTDITKRKTTEIELHQSQERLRNSLEEVRRLSEHLQNIREEERISIAREIHDELGQQLTVLKMDISWLNKKITVKEDNVQQKMNDLIGLIDNTVKTVRRISSELRPSILDDLGLVAAMEWHAGELEKHSGLKIKLALPEQDVLLSSAQKTGIFRIFQESLTNVIRHAGARKVEIDLYKNNGNLMMKITDDGVGFENKTISEKRTLGILGMKERTNMMGGVYEISSELGKGTAVSVAIPVGLSK